MISKSGFAGSNIAIAGNVIKTPIVTIAEEFAIVTTIVFSSGVYLPLNVRNMAPNISAPTKNTTPNFRANHIPRNVMMIPTTIPVLNARFVRGNFGSARTTP